jgi:hypothetical protein
MSIRAEAAAKPMPRARKKFRQPPLACNRSTIPETLLLLPGRVQLQERLPSMRNGGALNFDRRILADPAECKWLSGFALTATFEGEFSDMTRSYARKGFVRYQW